MPGLEDLIPLPPGSLRPPGRRGLFKLKRFSFLWEGVDLTPTPLPGGRRLPGRGANAGVMLRTQKQRERTIPLLLLPL